MEIKSVHSYLTNSPPFQIQHINISDLTTVCTEQLLGLQDVSIQDGTVQIRVQGIDHDMESTGKSLCLIDNSDASDEKGIGENIQIQHIKSEEIDDEDLM
jgi:hypothetical protein